MSTLPNSFLTEKLSPHEQYIMFIGYMDRVHAEMGMKLETEDLTEVQKRNGHKVNSFVMAIMNKKVVQMLFPDGHYSMPEIQHIGEEMTTLRIGDRIGEIMDEISAVTEKYAIETINSPEKAEAVFRELIK